MTIFVGGRLHGSDIEPRPRDPETNDPIGDLPPSYVDLMKGEVYRLQEMNMTTPNPITGVLDTKRSRHAYIHQGVPRDVRIYMDWLQNALLYRWFYDGGIPTNLTAPHNGKTPGAIVSEE